VRVVVLNLLFLIEDAGLEHRSVRIRSVWLRFHGCGDDINYYEVQLKEQKGNVPGEGVVRLERLAGLLAVQYVCERIG
jgi:hypothetical protein